MVALEFFCKALNVALLVIRLDDEVVARSLIPVSPRRLGGEQGEEGNGDAVDC